MEIFKITTASSQKTLDWPAWLQVAWERDWGTKSSFAPAKDGGYVAIDSAGDEREFRAGDFITADVFV